MPHFQTMQANTKKPPAMPRSALPLLAVLTLAGCSAALAACGGPTRGVVAYCTYLYGQGGQLRIHWKHSASQDPLSALGSAFSAPGELAGFFHGLSERAPEAIAPDVQTLGEAFKRISEQEGAAASDPLGALASGLAEGLASTGAEQRFNEYSLRYCGPPPGTQSGVALP
jgi:hypothetical protein